MARTAKRPAARDVPNNGAPAEDTRRDALSEGPWRDRVVTRSLGAARSQSIDRGAAFVRAAMEILEVEGESLTVQDVADRAGFSLRILYRHFASKDDLLAAVLEESLSTAAKRMRIQSAKITDPVKRLATFIADLVGNERTPFTVALAKHELALRAERADEVARAHAPMAQLALEVVSSVASEGKMTHCRPEDAVSLIFATTRSYNYSKLLGDTSGLTVTAGPAAAPAGQSDVVAYCLRGIGVSVNT